MVETWTQTEGNIEEEEEEIIENDTEEVKDQSIVKEVVTVEKVIVEECGIQTEWDVGLLERQYEKARAQIGETVEENRVVRDTLEKVIDNSRQAIQKLKSGNTDLENQRDEYLQKYRNAVSLLQRLAGSTIENSQLALCDGK